MKEQNTKWKAETDKHHGPHLRLYKNGKRTTVLILPQFVSKKAGKVLLSEIKEMEKMVQIGDAKPF